MMKLCPVFILLSIFLVGCSGLSTSIAPDSDSAISDTEHQDNHWSWGIWEFGFNADHTKVELIPKRRAQYHFCVTKFMENWPCSDCLTIGKPKPQGDGTLKLNVTMRHPFPNTPRYTGFDVRGVVYFPPTKIQATNDLYYASRIYDDNPNPEYLFPPPYNKSMPLIFSRAEDGGGELLNADGCSCYLVPGLVYSLKWPIFSYSDPKNNMDPTPELTTINPYKLFASGNDRRMFLVSDEITKEYHFDLPPGPFNFGYAVDASWWQPTKLPVADPASDFPPEANAEDPWLIEYEQLLPISEENIGKDIFKVTIHHRGLDTFDGLGIWTWGLTLGAHNDMKPLFGLSNPVVIDDYTLVEFGQIDWYWWYLYGKDGLIVPGHHTGVLVVFANPFESPYKNELEHIYGVRFVDIYVEG
jgi:hypothetical protein